jgi:hypothetical protein
MLSIDILTSIKILSPHQGGHLEFALLVSSHAPTYELVFSCLYTHCLVWLTLKICCLFKVWGVKVNYVGVHHGNGYELFFNLSFHAFVKTSQEMWLLFGRSKLLGQCVAKWNDRQVDQLWSQHSNPTVIRPWFGYVTIWLRVATNHSCFDTRSLQISYMETSCIFQWNCTRRNLVLFHPHTL